MSDNGDSSSGDSRMRDSALITAAFTAGWVAAFEFVAEHASGPPGFAEWLREQARNPPEIAAIPLGSPPTQGPANA